MRPEHRRQNAARVLLLCSFVAERKSVGKFHNVHDGRKAVVHWGKVCSLLEEGRGCGKEWHTCVWLKLPLSEWKSAILFINKTKIKYVKVRLWLIFARFMFAARGWGHKYSEAITGGDGIRLESVLVAFPVNCFMQAHNLFFALESLDWPQSPQCSVNMWHCLAPLTRLFVDRARRAIDPEYYQLARLHTH